MLGADLGLHSPGHVSLSRATQVHPDLLGLKGLPNGFVLALVKRTRAIIRIDMHLRLPVLLDLELVHLLHLSPLELRIWLKRGLYFGRSNQLVGDGRGCRENLRHLEI